MTASNSTLGKIVEIVNPCTIQVKDGETEQVRQGDEAGIHDGGTRSFKRTLGDSDSITVNSSS
ncbi:MAG: hypothetical protein ACJ71K_13465 [Nitrososphaeraceae archaeon]